MTDQPNSCTSASTAPGFEVAPMGVSGWLVRFGSQVNETANEKALAFHQAMQNDPIDGIVESAPSLVSVFLQVDPVRSDLDALRSEITARAEALLAGTLPPSSTRRWTVPCAFDGPQLAEAAQLAGCTEAQAVQEITEAELRVLTLGFAPGQPYLGTLPAHWDIPRMSAITPNVPQGALIIAVRQVILFANDAPTGWRHIGNSAFRCFDEARDTPIALNPGDKLRIAQASPEEIAALRASGDPLGGARCENLS